MIALPLVDGEKSNVCVNSGLREAGDWECFRFKCCTLPSPALLATADAATRLLAQWKAGSLRASIARNDSAAECEFIARVAPEHDFEQLAAAIKQDTDLRDRLLKLAGADPYAIGLRNLLATEPEPPQRRRWFSRRLKGATSAHVDLANDGRFVELGAASQEGTYVSFVQKTNAVLRRLRIPSKRLCVLATMRDEGPYILEWVAYHRSLGVEHFFIYSNGNKDGSDALLRALSKEGVITWIENTGSTANVQRKAYGHCLSIVPNILDYEWCAVLDADEFITLRDGYFGTIDEYIGWQESQPVDVIALPWAVFWSNGHVRWTDELSIQRFNRQNQGSGLGKSLLRPRKLTFSHPHHPASADHTVSVVVRDCMRQQITYSRGQLTGYELPDARYETAWINHYFSRSAEELLWKWSRGRGDGQSSHFAVMSDSFVVGFMQHYDNCEMLISDGVTHKLPAVRQEIESLLSLPGVRDAQIEVIARRVEWASHTPELVSQLMTQDLSEIKQAFLRLLV